MPNLDVIEKLIPARTIAHITALVTDQSEIGPWIGPAYERLMRAMQRDGYPVTGPSMAWYRSEGDRLRIAAAFPTTAAPDDSGTLRTELDEPVVVEELEAAPEALTLVHHGCLETLAQSWQTLATTVQDRGRRRSGRAREIYLSMPADDSSAQEWVVELQQPVQQASSD